MVYSLLSVLFIAVCLIGFVISLGVGWLIKKYNGQQLTSNPINYFEFESSFCSVITVINNTTYKYGKYYSVNDTISYYIDTQSNPITFNKNNLVKFILESDVIAKISLINYFKDNFQNIFTFDEGLKIINTIVRYVLDRFFYFAIKNYRILVKDFFIKCNFP